MMDLKNLKNLLAERLQSGLPLTERPYRVLASVLECDERTVLSLANELVLEGYIRSFGAFVDFARLGYAGLLCGLAVPEEEALSTAAFLNERREITHHYLRAHSVNLWFTAIIEAGERERFIEEVPRACKRPFIVLATEARLKLRPIVHFSHLSHNLSHSSCGERFEAEYLPGEAPKVTVDEKALRALCLLQDHFPISSEPFGPAADQLGCSVPQLLKLLRLLEKSRVLRRIGASLRHRLMGYRANALIAWSTDALSAKETAQETQRWFLSLPWVSHAYLRKVVASTLPFGWPYSLFTMLHAADGPSLAERIRSMKNKLGQNAVVLLTVQELKKTRYRLPG